MTSISCIGFIMDGNRRWAREQNLPTIEGHRIGYGKLKDLIKWSREENIHNIVVYGFSTENWNRDPEEVSYLMELIRGVLGGNKSEFDEIKQNGGRIKIIGQRERFSKDIQKLMTQVEKETEGGMYTLWLALSYGGRAEIVDAVNRLVQEGKEVTEEIFSKALWTEGMPDPDIIIRTSGEYRLSGFLPWQSVYSELFFIERNWPDFSREDFDRILVEYAQRERRHGK